MIHSDNKNRNEYLIVLILLFFFAQRFTLPVPYNDEVGELFPFWAKPLSYNNIQISELLYVYWFLKYKSFSKIFVWWGSNSTLTSCSAWLIFFAIWTGTISLFGPSLLQDLGRTFRLLLNASLIVSAAIWATKFRLRTFYALITGFLTGSIINIIITYEYPLIVDGVLRLAGQNTAGVATAIAIHCTCWLYCLEKSKFQRMYLIFATLFLMYCTALSYSRIGWAIGIFGVCVWLIALYKHAAQNIQKTTNRKNNRSFLLILFVVIVLCVVWNFDISGIASNIFDLVSQKFNSGYEEGDSHRMSYVFSTAEILIDYPLGVGYSGFYDAVITTDQYKSGQAAIEEGLDANPHASILYFATSGGIPGLIIGCVVFYKLMRVLKISLSVLYGCYGKILFAFSFLSYVLISLTVPYLLNSTILILPACLLYGLCQRSNNANKLIKYLGKA